MEAYHSFLFNSLQLYTHLLRLRKLDSYYSSLYSKSNRCNIRTIRVNRFHSLKDSAPTLTAAYVCAMNVKYAVAMAKCIYIRWRYCKLLCVFPLFLVVWLILVLKCLSEDLRLGFNCRTQRRSSVKILEFKKHFYWRW